MRKRIVYTRHDGGVTICCPSANAIAWMANGGRWAHMPHGFAETQIERQIAAGHGADAVRRFVRAMTDGGCTTAEALAIIRDRDCAHLGTAIELWDVDDVPRDRWFRNAWTRSHNGGPISIHLERARLIQWQRARYAVERENKRRADDMELFAEPLAVDWQAIKARIMAARDEIDLRRVWPDGLRP